jgi:hypothetical protein
MLTLASRAATQEVQATDVRFEDNRLVISLSDDREISVPLDRAEWLSWLAKATPEQRERWTIEPGGYAVYWDELDDGIEICHLLAMQPLG